MEIAGLEQPGYCTTLMGCVRGVSELWKLGHSVAMLYGLSGHAFLINMHTEVCPSSPYVWEKRRFRELLDGIGIATVAEYTVTRETPDTERRSIEESLKAHLDLGDRCMLDFLEHQLIKGYDGERFHLIQPWQGHAPSEVPSLTFGTWAECLDKEGWAHVTVLGKVPPRPLVPDAARDALRYARELYDSPAAHQREGYRMGSGAWDNWVAAVEKGLGTEHGHRWNGAVWSECRTQAAAFMTELAAALKPGAAGACETIAEHYTRVAKTLTAAGNKDLTGPERLRHLREARDADRAAFDGLAAIEAAI